MVSEGDVLTFTGGHQQFVSKSVQLATVTLSSTELKALLLTPKELLPAPGGRNYYVIHGIVLHYRFNTMPYTGDFRPSFGYGSSLADISPATGVGLLAALDAVGVGALPGSSLSEAGLLAQEADAYIIMTDIVMAGAFYFAWMADAVENVAFLVANFPPKDFTQPIGSVDQGTKTFTIANFDVASFLDAGNEVVVENSTGNDGTYTVVSATFNDIDTEIVVVEDIPDATADGAMYPQAALADGDGSLSIRILYTTINGAP